MDFKSFLNKLSQHYRESLPFAIFAESGSKTIHGILQQNSELYTNEFLSENGFVLAPFDDRKKTLLIPKSHSQSFESEFVSIKTEEKRISISESREEKNVHEKLLQKTIKTIQSGKAKKIVISRNKTFPLSNFSLEDLINRLFSAYPTAYRYIWFHPETGIWCGATPEVLVHVNNNHLETMALAGTQPFHKGEITWRQKELEEQHFVTEAILENLKDNVENIEVSKIKSVRAGSLLHLVTDITATLKNKPGILAEIVKTMHPTPAVCGTPKSFSKEFIIAEENYARKFYTGFVGIISDNGSSAALRVNLRCMNIENDHVHIMVGGGITKDSDVEEEWVETQNKMQTMLQVIHPMLQI